MASRTLPTKVVRSGLVIKGAIICTCSSAERNERWHLSRSIPIKTSSDPDDAVRIPFDLNACRN